MVTSAYDIKVALKLSDIENDIKIDFTKLCHIIPFSIGAFSEDEVGIN